MKIDKGITKESLFCCLYELSLMQCVSENEEEEIYYKINCLTNKKIKRLQEGLK